MCSRRVNSLPRGMQFRNGQALRRRGGACLLHLDAAAHAGGVEVAVEGVVAGYLGDESHFPRLAAAERLGGGDSVVLSVVLAVGAGDAQVMLLAVAVRDANGQDRKSTRLNSSHV